MAAATKPIIAGTKKPQRQPKYATTAPITKKVSPSPIECAVLQRP